MKYLALVLLTAACASQPKRSTPSLTPVFFLDVENHKLLGFEAKDDGDLSLCVMPKKDELQVPGTHLCVVLWQEDFTRLKAHIADLEASQCK